MSHTINIEAPWFEDFRVGDRFEDAPAVTITDGHATMHQMTFGDRLRLPLDRVLTHRVTGANAALVNPGLVCNLAIGQSTYVSQRVMGNLFYRGLILKSPVYIGDTIHTTTEVVALRQNTIRPGRASTGMVALRMEVVNQRGEQVAAFYRCPMLPCKNADADTGHADSFDDLPDALEFSDLEAAVPDWDLARFRQLAAGHHFNELQTDRRLVVEAMDTVTSAPELARMTLNMAMTHTDAGKSVYGSRLVYGGHSICMAAAQLVRALPNLVTILAWRSCDHLAPVFEQDRLRSEVTISAKYPFDGGGGLVDLQVETLATRGPEAENEEADVKVLDWALVGLFA